MLAEPNKNKQMKHDTSCYHHRQEARCEYLLQEKKKQKLGRSTLSRGWPKQGLQVLLFWLLTGNLTLDNPTNLLLPVPVIL